MNPEYLKKEILILGCGNLLFGDDGFGCYVVEKLKDILKDNKKIAILDVGSGASQVLTLIDKDSKVKKIIVIDAIDYNLKPGEVVVLELDDLPNIEYDRIDAHGWKLSTMLKELKDFNIDIKVIGCQIKELPEEMKIGLSKEVEKAIDKAIELILKEVEVYESSTSTTK